MVGHPVTGIRKNETISSFGFYFYMKILKITIVSVAMVSLAALPIFSLSLEELVGSSSAAALRAGQTISEIQLANPELRLLPRHSGLLLLSENIRRNLEPVIIAETLQLYVKPENSQSGRPSSWNAGEKLALFNAITALSTLEGLQYYSASRGTMRTFYEVSTIIDGPSTKRPQPDTIHSYIPYSLTLYARQKDLTFGDNIYSYEYHSQSDALIFVQENQTALTLGIIPAVSKNRLRSIVAIIDTGDCLLLYAASMAKATALPGLRDRIGSSFSNRAEAVMNWVTDRAEMVYMRN